MAAPMAADEAGQEGMLGLGDAEEAVGAAEGAVGAAVGAVEEGTVGERVGEALPVAGKRETASLVAVVAAECEEPEERGAEVAREAETRGSAMAA